MRAVAAAGCATGLILLLLGACGRDQDAAVEAPPAAGVPAAPEAPPLDRYEGLRARIRAGDASLQEIEEALTEADLQGLSNTLLHLYLVREQPGAADLLQDLWHRRAADWPALNWVGLDRTAARVALAHTLARIHPQGAEVYLGAIREALADPDPFARAQAVVALSFVGDDGDLPMLEALARYDTPYAAEAAIKALAIHGGESARGALLRLGEHHRGDPAKSAVIRQVLLERYGEPASPQRP